MSWILALAFLCDNPAHAPVEGQVPDGVVIVKATAVSSCVAGSAVTLVLQGVETGTVPSDALVDDEPVELSHSQEGETLTVKTVSRSTIPTAMQVTLVQGGERVLVETNVTFVWDHCE